MSLPYSVYAKEGSTLVSVHVIQSLFNLRNLIYDFKAGELDSRVILDFFKGRMRLEIVLIMVLATQNEPSDLNPGQRLVVRLEWS